jgi:hypothetical protein
MSAYKTGYDTFPVQANKTEKVKVVFNQRLVRGNLVYVDSIPVPDYTFY